jgi:hypothetical protein
VKIAVLMLATCLAGCNTILHINGEEAQQIVDKRAVGISAGDFFQRYGAPYTREEARDGSLSFNWEGGLAKIAAGPRGLEEKICRLHISADKNGRILAAPIIRDAQGEHRLSRCAELFD